MNRCIRKPRHGITLIEVLAVTVLLAVVAVGAANMRQSTSVLSSIKAQTETNQLVSVLRASRTLALTTTLPHRCRLIENRDTWAAYVVERFDGRNWLAVHEPVALPSEYQISASSDAVTFDAAGNATQSWTLKANGGRSSYIIEVSIAGGMVTYEKV